MRTLEKADTQGLFSFVVWSPDTYREMLDFVKHENSDKGVTA